MFLQDFSTIHSYGTVWLKSMNDEERERERERERMSKYGKDKMRN